MAGRSSINERLRQLERRASGRAKRLSKVQRDAMVKAALDSGDIAPFLTCESEPHHRAAIEAAFRADS